MKLIELEMSMDGLSKRSQVFIKLGQMLSRDWGDTSLAINRRSQEGSRIRDREEQETKLLERYKNLEKLLTDDS
jgi:DNA sulfur modification protein DndC